MICHEDVQLAQQHNCSAVNRFSGIDNSTAFCLHDPTVTTLHKIRLGAAIALICTLFLPLSQCSRNENTVPSNTKPPALQLFPQSDKQISYEYAVGELEFSVRGIMTLLAFTWPLLFVFTGGKLQNTRFTPVQHLLELTLCGGTLYWLHCLTRFGHWMYGAYVVLISIILFGGTSLLYLYHAARTFLQAKKG